MSDYNGSCFTQNNIEKVKKVMKKMLYFDKAPFNIMGSLRNVAPL